MSGLVILGYAFGGFAIFAGLLCLIGSAAGGNRVIPCVPPPLKSESGSFNLTEQPSDADLRIALWTLNNRGQLTGALDWSVACARYVNRLGPDPNSEAGEACYRRVARSAGVRP